MPRLLLATNNAGKVREFRDLLQDLPYELVTPAQAHISMQVEETGQTMQENARLKAVTLARQSGLLTLADDSGLEVDALNGEPGIRSARYAGDKATDADKIDYLLLRLHDIPWEKRTARFRCVIAVATPLGKVELCEATCEGMIALAPKGNLGFGYDPVFYFPELCKTMAELPEDVKNKVSHRGQAARQVPAALKRLLGDI